jgi:hypothetical protein
MKRIWILGSAIAALIFSFNANAGLYIEPKVDYSALALESSLPAGGLKGTMVGARLGYSLPLVTLAVDYSTGSPEADLNSVKVSSDNTRTCLTAIFAPPVLPFNILAGYYTSTLEVSGTKYEGDGTKFGLMLTMLPFININLEYFATAYDQNSLRDKGVMAGLSVDFSL